MAGLRGGVTWISFFSGTDSVLGEASRASITLVTAGNLWRTLTVSDLGSVMGGGGNGSASSDSGSREMGLVLFESDDRLRVLVGADAEPFGPSIHSARTSPVTSARMSLVAHQ
jgi:hypothetical protein